MSYFRKFSEDKYLHGLFPSILIHLGLGGIYSWSQITNKVAYEIGTSESSIHLVFMFLAFFMGMSALVSNYVCRKIGLRTSLGIGAALFVIGMSLSSISIEMKSINTLIIGYGVISSIGMGLCYLIPIKNVMMWFPKSSGLSVGLTICSFNVSGLISTAAVCILYEYGASVILSALLILGICPILLGVSLIKKPELNNVNKTPRKKGDLINLVFSQKFIIIWMILSMKLSAGLMMFYNMIPISNYSLTAFDYNSIIMIAVSSAISCGLGKLVIPWVSDKIEGSKLKINYFIFGLPLLFMIISYLYHDWSIIPALLIVSSFMYGAGLSSIPVILKECYGFKFLGTIQCIMFTSWCVAGLLGAKLGGEILNRFGLNMLLLSATTMYAVGLILSIVLIKKVNKEKIYELP